MGLVITPEMLARVVKVNRVLVVIGRRRGDDEHIRQLARHPDRLRGKGLVVPADEEAVGVIQGHLHGVLSLAVVFRVRGHLVVGEVEGAPAGGVPGGGVGFPSGASLLVAEDLVVVVVEGDGGLGLVEVAGERGESREADALAVAQVDLEVLSVGNQVVEPDDQLVRRLPLETGVPEGGRNGAGDVGTDVVDGPLAGTKAGLIDVGEVG